MHFSGQFLIIGILTIYLESFYWLDITLSEILITEIAWIVMSKWLFTP